MMLGGGGGGSLYSQNGRLQTKVQTDAAAATQPLDYGVQREYLTGRGGEERGKGGGWEEERGNGGGDYGWGWAEGGVKASFPINH